MAKTVKKATKMIKEEGAENNKLEKALLELENEFGLKSLKKDKVESTSSGSYMIDRATGIGGIPNGKVVEIWGPESSGKSTIVQHIMASYQKTYPDKKVAYFDYEYSLDPIYASAIGINMDTLLVYQPDNQEVGMDMICQLVEKGIVSLVVIDSHTAATPKKIIEGEMGDATMAMQARNNSKFFAKIKGPLERTKTTLIGVSQTRANIGGMGDVIIPTGGNAWKFYADMRLKIWKQLDKEKESNKTTLDVVKNKCANPYGKAEFDILWGVGIFVEKEILDLAIEKGMIKRSGSWFSYNDSNIGQGAESVCQLFKDNVDLYNEIKEKVLT